MNNPNNSLRFNQIYDAKALGTIGIRVARHMINRPPGHSARGYAPRWLLVDINVILFFFFFFPPVDDVDGPEAAGCASAADWAMTADSCCASNSSSQPCNHPSLGVSLRGSRVGESDATAVVPQTVREPGGLLEGEANAPNWEDARGGEAEDAPASNKSGSWPLDNGWKSCAENGASLALPILGRLRRAAAHRLSSSSFSARIRSFSSRASFSRLRFRLRSVSERKRLRTSGTTTSLQSHSRKLTSQP